MDHGFGAWRLVVDLVLLFIGFRLLAAVWKLASHQERIEELLSHLDRKLQKSQDKTQAELQALRADLAKPQATPGPGSVPPTAPGPEPSPVQEPPSPGAVPVPPTPAPVTPVPVAESTTPAAPAVPEPAITPAALTALALTPPAKPPEATVPPRLPPLLPTPEPPPATPEPKSTLELATADVLRKVWNWIVYGAERRDEGVSIEYAVATNWLVRVFVVVLVIGVGLFLKYSFEHGWIDASGRVAIGILTGVGMVAAGVRLLDKRYHLFGQGLIGGGLAILYFSFFSAFSIYHLIGMVTAFALMGLVTLSAGVLAVRFNALLIAVLGIVGGYGTPFMLSTGTANFPGLFGYLLLLGAGILGIAYARDWPLLNWLGFLGHYAVVLAALDKHYRVESFSEVMPFLAGGFMLYTAVTIIYNLVRRRRSTLIEVTGLVLNAAVFFVLGHRLISEAYSKEWVAAVSLSLAVLYIAMVFFFLKARLADRDLLLTLTALAGFFVTITMPLLLSAEWLTVSWAVQALLFLWISGKLDSRFLRLIGYVVYGLVLWRLWFIDFGRTFDGWRGRHDMPLAEYWHDLVSRLTVFGVAIASFAGAWRLQRRPGTPAAAWRVTPANDIDEWLKGNLPVQGFLGVAMLIGFVYLHLELSRMFWLVYAPLRFPVLTLLWAALILVLVSFYRQARSDGTLALVWLAVAGMLTKLFLFDLPAWDMQLEYFCYGPTHNLGIDALMRLVDFGTVVALLAGCAWALAAWGAPVGAAAVFGVMAVGMLFIYLTWEVSTFLGVYAAGARAGGVSILWSLFALAFLVTGIRRGQLATRLTGLALFAVVAAKVFASDLAHLEAIYRIFAFIVLGILGLCGSLLYLRNRQKFAIGSEEKETTA